LFHDEVGAAATAAEGGGGADSDAAAAQVSPTPAEQAAVSRGQWERERGVVLWMLREADRRGTSGETAEEARRAAARPAAGVAAERAEGGGDGAAAEDAPAAAEEDKVAAKAVPADAGFDDGGATADATADDVADATADTEPPSGLQPPVPFGPPSAVRDAAVDLAELCGRPVPGSAEALAAAASAGGAVGAGRPHPRGRDLPAGRAFLSALADRQARLGCANAVAQQNLRSVLSQARSDRPLVFRAT